MADQTPDLAPNSGGGSAGSPSGGGSEDSGSGNSSAAPVPPPGYIWICDPRLTDQQKSGHLYQTFILDPFPQPEKPAEKPSVVASAQGTDTPIAVSQQAVIVSAAEPSPAQGSANPTPAPMQATALDYLRASTNKDWGADHFSNATKALRKGDIFGAVGWAANGVGEIATDAMDAAIVRGTGWSPLATIHTAATLAKQLGLDNSKYSAGNFRQNLVRLTGKDPKGYDAHHIFPQKQVLQQRFVKAGINIHDPHHGSWFEHVAHNNSASKWNDEWTNYFQLNPYAEKQDILDQGRKMAQEWGLVIYF